MPQEYVKKMAKQYDVSIPAAEKFWKKAKQAAEDQGKKDNYAYVTSIFKNMMGIEGEEMSKKDKGYVWERPENLKEGKMSEISLMIDDEFEAYARIHGDEWTATHMDQTKNHIAGKVAKKYKLEKKDALKLVNDALSESVDIFEAGLPPEFRQNMDKLNKILGHKLGTPSRSYVSIAKDWGVEETKKKIDQIKELRKEMVSIPGSTYKWAMQHDFTIKGLNAALHHIKESTMTFKEFLMLNETR